MLRILHLTDSWGPGGAETVYSDLAAGIGSPAFQSFAGLPRASDWLYDTVRARGIEPIILPNSGSFDHRHLRRLIAVVKKHRIDVIQAHTFGSSVYASLAGFICRLPVVGTLHGRIDLANDDKRRAAKFRILGLGSTVLVPVSNALRSELLATTSVAPSRACVIYNGVDTNLFVPGENIRQRRELGIRDEELLIGAVGNVREVKGYDVLIDAAARLKGRGAKFRIVVVGQAEGAVFQEIEQQCADNGLLDRVVFTGFRSDTHALYRMFDIYALTSRSEGFPLSTIQALSAGLPIVATRCGGPEEMLEEGRTGLLAESGSGADVADKIERLITNPDLRRSLGVAARAEAQRSYSTGAMLTRYGALYQKLACGRFRSGSDQCQTEIG